MKHYPLFKEEMNGFGLRGKPFLQQSPDQRYRVVVLGDSISWGQGVYPYDKRFPEKAEQLFNNRKTREEQLEIINTGICGQNLPYHCQYLSFVQAIHPDFILYQWYPNDMDIYPLLSRILPTPLIQNKSIHKYLWEHSVLYFLVQNLFNSYQTKTDKKQSYTEYLIKRFKDPNSKASLRAQGYLSKLIDDLNNSGVDFGIVLFPTFSGPMDDYQLDFLHEQVLAVCREQQLNCLDLRETFKDVPYKDLWANVFDHHPSELAHKMAAEAVHAHFSPKWQAAIREKIKEN